MLDLKRLRCLIMGEASFRESVPQRSSAREEVVRVRNSFLPVEYEGNKDESILCRRQVESEL